MDLVRQLNPCCAFHPDMGNSYVYVQGKSSVICKLSLSLLIILYLVKKGSLISASNNFPISFCKSKFLQIIAPVSAFKTF